MRATSTDVRKISRCARPCLERQCGQTYLNKISRRRRAGLFEQDFPLRELVLDVDDHIQTRSKCPHRTTSRPKQNHARRPCHDGPQKNDSSRRPRRRPRLVFATTHDPNAPGNVLHSVSASPIRSHKNQKRMIKSRNNSAQQLCYYRLSCCPSQRPLNVTVLTRANTLVSCLYFFRYVLRNIRTFWRIGGGPAPHNVLPASTCSPRDRCVRARPHACARAAVHATAACARPRVRERAQSRGRAPD